LALPAFGALVAEPIYILTDTAFMGHVGTDSLAALAIASAVLLSAHSALIFLAYGTTGIVGRLLGSGKHKEAAGQGIQALCLPVILGIITSVKLINYGRTLISLYHPEAADESLALTYLRISLIGFTCQLVALAGTGYLRGTKDTKTPLVIAICGALTNLLLEIIFVFYFDLGITGSALSTVIAQWLSAFLYLSAIRSSTKELGLSFRPDFRSLAVYARIGFQLFIRTAALRSSLLIAAALASRLGTTEVASHQIGLEIWSLLALTLDAIAIAGQALVANALGAEDFKTARNASNRMVGINIQAGLVFGTALLVFNDQLPYVFTRDLEVVQLSSFILVFVAIAQPLNGLVFALDGIFMGAGDFSFLAKAMVGAFVIFIVIAAVINKYDLGIGWLWSAITILTILRAIPLCIRFKGNTWLKSSL
ncbi:MAG: MATE family efflux transporter, partial [Acidimicrobiales bacterium]|nr:MATE family efflux transporter [Acidimicrobiales bacterium]